MMIDQTNEPTDDEWVLTHEPADAGDVADLIRFLALPAREGLVLWG